MTKTDSKLLGKVLGALLKKQYPQATSSDKNWITLDVLLEWIPWPSYLQIVQQGQSISLDTLIY